MNKKFNDREFIKNWFYDHQDKIYSAIAKIENIKISAGETNKIIDAYLNDEIPHLENVALSSFFMIIGVWQAYKTHFLNTNMTNDELVFDIENLKNINKLIGSYEDSRCGHIRQHKVRLKNINYMPPESWDEGFLNKKLKNFIHTINKLNNENMQKELIAFVFNVGAEMIKEQWFPNSNNRTVSLFMNVALLHSGLGFYYVPKEKIDEYKSLRNNFYENDNNKNVFVNFMINDCFGSINQLKQEKSRCFLNQNDYYESEDFMNENDNNKSNTQKKSSGQGR